MVHSAQAWRISTAPLESLPTDPWSLWLSNLLMETTFVLRLSTHPVVPPVWPSCRLSRGVQDRSTSLRVNQSLRTSPWWYPKPSDLMPQHQSFLFANPRVPVLTDGWQYAYTRFMLNKTAMHIHDDGNQHKSKIHTRDLNPRLSCVWRLQASVNHWSSESACSCIQVYMHQRCTIHKTKYVGTGSEDHIVESFSPMASYNKTKGKIKKSRQCTTMASMSPTTKASVTRTQRHTHLASQ